MTIEDLEATGTTREDIEAALAIAIAAQTTFWDSLGTLESLIPGLELDSTSDMAGWDADTVVEMVKDEEVDG